MSSIGSSDWPHLSAILKSHEVSIFHSENFKSWKLLENGLKSGTLIDTLFESKVEEETRHWKAVLQRLFSVVKFLGF